MKPTTTAKLLKTLYWLMICLSILAMVMGLMELAGIIQPLISGHLWPARQNWPLVAAIAGKWILPSNRLRVVG